jgi:hypothetical protein
VNDDLIKRLTPPEPVGDDAAVMCHAGLLREAVNRIRDLEARLQEAETDLAAAKAVG